MISSEHLSAIRSFMAAARSQNFSQAAELLGLTSSAVGKSVARLETHLGVRLFQRTTRRMTLTEDGAMFLQACQRAFSELDAVEATLASRLREPAGRLRISLPELLGKKLVVPVLLELSRRYRLLSFDISFSNRLTELVDGGFDLAVRIGQVGDAADLVARPLGKQNIVICASSTYLHQRGTPCEIDHLREHDCITYARADGPAPWLLNDRHGIVQDVNVAGTFSIGSYEAMYLCALEGAGVAQLPTWLVSDALEDGRLLPVMTAFNPPGLPIQAVWPNRKDMNPRTRVLTDALVSRFRSF
jgi:DNA-binding transcriptional LysR family regulator